MLPEFLWTQSLCLQWRQGPPATRTRGQRFAHLIACSFTGDHFEKCRLTFPTDIGREGTVRTIMTVRVQISLSERDNMHWNTAVDFSLIKLS